MQKGILETSYLEVTNLNLALTFPYGRDFTGFDVAANREWPSR